MTHDDDARVADLLARLGDGDSKELFRRLLEAGMQELVDAGARMTALTEVPQVCSSKFPTCEAWSG